MKTFPISSLPDGAKFTIPSLRDIYRNMKLIHGSDCAAQVIGKHKSFDSWGPYDNYIAPSTLVIPGWENEDNEEEIETVKIVKEKKSSRIKQTIELPRGKEFTVSELAKQMNVKPYTIHNEIGRRKNEITIVRTERTENQRGKPTNVYIIQ